LVAVADLIKGHLENVLAEFPDIATYPDHNAMLDEADLDVLVVATAPKFRLPIVQDSAGKVRGIYMEKPIAHSLAEADTMIQQCRDNGTVLTIGHQRRWSREWLWIRDAIRDGAIGRPTHGWVTWSLGRIFANGTHFFDSINFVLDSRPTEVRGTLDFGSGTDMEGADPYLIQSVMSFDPGARGVITYANDARIAVDGQNDVMLPFTHIFAGTRGRIQIEEESRYNIDYRARDSDTRDLRDRAPIIKRDTPEFLALEPGESERQGYRELLRCIETGSPSTSSGEDGRLAMEIIVALHLSHEAGGRPVSLPLPDSALSYILRHQG
jgi:predicted dehydrogenase